MFEYKNILKYWASAALFIVLFWLTGFFLWELYLGPRALENGASGKEREMNERYSQQLIQAEEQLAVVTAQQKRMETILSRQERQADQYDGILRKWEGQSIPNKNQRK